MGTQSMLNHAKHAEVFGNCKVHFFSDGIYMSMKKHFLVCMLLGHFLCHNMESKPDTQTLTSSFIVIYIDSLQLQVTVAMVTACGVYAMLIAYHLPKLQ